VRVRQWDERAGTTTKGGWIQTHIRRDITTISTDKADNSGGAERGGGMTTSKKIKSKGKSISRAMLVTFLFIAFVG